MKAWLFQDTRQKTKLGGKCPWSVGWYDHAGHKKSKKVGAKSTAEKLRKRIEAELALNLSTDRSRQRWSDFREKFVEVVLESKAPKTADAYQSALDTFERIVRPVYMDTISTVTIDTYRAKRSKEAACVPIRRKANADKPAEKKVAEKNPRLVSEATVNLELRHIRAALRKAWRWGMLPQPPEVAMLREPQRDPYFVDDATFGKLYDACDAMTRPADRHYPARDWWRALLTFAYMTGWRIGEILDLRREDLDIEKGIAVVDAESTKGRREARVELHDVVLDHVRPILDFQPHVFHWPYHERTLWEDFTALKAEAGVEFQGAFHRLRFGFANANVDRVDEMVLQKLMRHKSSQTTRHYINIAERLRRSGVADRLHVPACLKTTPA